MKKKYPNYSSLSFTKKLEIVHNAKIKSLIQEEIKNLNSLYETGGKGKVDQLEEIKGLIEIIILKEIQLEIYEKNKLDNDEKKINNEINAVLEDMCISLKTIKMNILKNIYLFQKH